MRFTEKKKGVQRRACLLVTCVFLLAGCGKKNVVVDYEASQGEITTITFFGNKYEPENVSVIEEILSGFMQENPDIQVIYESLKGTEYYEVLTKRVDAGKGNDVFMVNHDTVLDMKASGRLADLSDLAGISQYTDQMYAQMEENGKIYWVPTTVSAFGLYCNMDLLRQYGLEIPENLSEWKAACSLFQREGITPVIANNDISLKTLAIGQGFYQVYQENRQQEVFQSLNRGESQLSDYLFSSFATVSDFILNDYIDAEQALNTQKTSDDLAEFVKGEAPFMLTGAWAAGRVAAMNPGFEFQVVPYPVLEDGSLLVINADIRLGVNAEGSHVEEAKRFVEYFIRAENIEKLSDQQSSFSPLKGGRPSSVKQILPLTPSYESGHVVFGTDSLAEFPIWDLTAEASKGLLSGKSLRSVMYQMDQKMAKEIEKT